MPPKHSNISSDTLRQICDDKREHIASQKKSISSNMLQSRIAKQALPRGFLQALLQKNTHGKVALIAEVKKASPSKGIIRADFNPEAIAKSYQQGGAACISVLTDVPYFQGSDAYLKQVKDAVDLPVLRKDFILDSYQIKESRALGADCILLIMAALSDMQAYELEAEAHQLGMDVLVEVHNEEELDRAFKLTTPLIGINNRNLKTLDVDISTTEQLAPKIPDTYTLVCESGIATHNDIIRMNHSGAYCFLVGESLMKCNDIQHATKQLLGAV